MPPMKRPCLQGTNGGGQTASSLAAAMPGLIGYGWQLFLAKLIASSGWWCSEHLGCAKV
jgi:hypothetical protein